MKNYPMVYLFFCMILFSGCETVIIPTDIEQALNSSGSNRSEILKVVKHYAKEPSDSLRLKATFFLIKNMYNKYYYDGKFLENYLDYSKLVLRDIDHGEYIMNSLQKIHGPYSKDSLRLNLDLEQITAKQMITNIDESFNVWLGQPWSKNYTFDQFCNFILPFKIDNESPSFNRLKIYKQFSYLLKNKEKDSLDAIKACALINNKLIEDGWILTNRPAFLPHNGSIRVLESRVGTCREMVDLALYVMRASGIPVTSDFLPQWPYRRQGHTWNVVIGKNGKGIPFLGAEDSPGTPHRPGTRRGKVYRNSFIENPKSLARVNVKGEVIPSPLADPGIIDVTDEYAKTHNVEIQLSKKHGKFGYLSVFNNISWKPIAWAEIIDNKATFEKVEGGIIFLPTYYNKTGNIYTNDPFILNDEGSIQYLVADTVNVLPTLTCSRVYPIVAESYQTDNTKGGKIQGANKKDFSDAEDLFTFKVRSLPEWNEIPIKTLKRFRYLRYLSSSKNTCQVAEIAFFFGRNKISADAFTQPNEKNKNLDDALDGNTLTAYSSGINSWIGFDFGKDVKIDKVQFVAKIDIPEQHLIIPGQEYELKYWKDSKWNPLQKKIAKSRSVTFDNVPANGLYLLSSNFEVKDFRIFTYKNGKQIWW